MHIHKPPLKNRTRDRLGHRVKVNGDVAESRVHCGKFLGVKVQIDVTKKLVRGKKGIVFKGGGDNNG